MERVQKVLNQKWSIALAFIPVINLILILVLFIVSSKKLLSFLGMAAVGFVLWFLYRLFPENLYWVVTYLISVGMSLFVFCYTRNHVKTEVSKKEITFVIGIVVIIALAALLSSFESKKDIVSRKADEAIEALATGNVQNWQENIHPEQGAKLLDLIDYTSSLADKGIELAKNSYLDGDYYIKATENETEYFIELTQTVVSGQQAYRLTAVYLFSSDAEGFVSFQLKPLKASSVPYYDDSADPHGW